MDLTTRELLFLEDAAKLFESIEKNCTRGSQTTNDPEIKTLLQNLAEDHKQWNQSISSIVTQNNTIQ